MVRLLQEHHTMSQTWTLNPAPSPGFDRARKLSRFVAVLFGLGFLVMLSVGLSAIVFVFFPTTPSGAGHGIGLPGGFGAGFGGLPIGQAIGAMMAVELMTVPIVLVLYHMCRVFLRFARGETFTAEPIAHTRAAGVWLTLSFFTDLAAVYLLALSGQKSPILHAIRMHPYGVASVAVRFDSALFVGIPIIIAAYVMEEARRIAADNAEIV
jgi:hypothetical protein